MPASELILLLAGTLNFSMAQSEAPTLVHMKELTAKKPDTQGHNVKVWKIRQDETIRINLVEMSGELSMHKHPDAAHSLMVIDGKVKVQIGKEFFEIAKGDFVSIPANVPHKYWSLTKTSTLVSMDAPYYDPKKTVGLE